MAQLSNDERRNRMAKLVMLKYLNSELFKRGIITEEERNNMILAIEKKYGEKVS